MTLKSGQICQLKMCLRMISMVAAVACMVSGVLRMSPTLSIISGRQAM